HTRSTRDWSSDVCSSDLETKVNEKTFWGQIDVDVLKGGSPMWSFPSNLRLQGNSARIVGQLLEAVQQKASPGFREAAKARMAERSEERRVGTGRARA